MKQDETITLAQHSLYAVVRADKSLWQLPLTWSQTHLHALGVDRQSNNACVEYGCDKDAESLRALIPEQPFLESKIRTVRGYSCHERKAKCLRHLLVFMEPPPKLYPDTNALLFTCHQRALKLFVGSRAYRIHDEVTCFHLGRLAFAYLDAHRLRWPLKIRRKLSYGTVFDLDPCITGMLIAMAQAQAEESGTSSTTNKPVITARLLLTDRKIDQDNILVYTARVSPALLERFSHPSRSPTSAREIPDSTPSLLRLQMVRVSYEPIDTFCARVLAAVSIPDITVVNEDHTARDLASIAAPAAAIIHRDNCTGSRKRTSLEACDGIERKWPRLEDPRTPLQNTSSNG